ncbi:MAG TPA: pitrilysin family protein [Blastocatellia bacterium]|nr:pitrilysin family protein [Blastocatellia bacterium]
MIMRRHILSTIGAFAVLGMLTFLVIANLDVGRQPNNLVPEIAFDIFTLDNGLTVILHEDHNSPWVAINIWYHVGARDEKPGKYSLAHLCEHLMFMGTEHMNEEFSKVAERLGAKDYNGSTDRDRTRFFMNVPRSALSAALWLESDRMGYALGALTDKKLDKARTEIEKETAGDGSSPYAFAEAMLARKLYPAEHPYSHHPLWSTQDLKSITLSDVKEWFRSNYHPSNAVLVLAGDIDIPLAREEVKKYFAGLRPGDAVNRELASVPRLGQLRRETVFAPVPYPRIYKAWNVPGYSNSDVDYLDLFRHILSLRLQEQLIGRGRLATSVSVSLKSFELCGQFQIEVTARAGGDLMAVEHVVNEQLEALRSQGPSNEELGELKAELLSSLTSDMERLGGLGGKSDILAISEVLAGDPGHYRKAFQRIQEAKPEDVKAVGNRWLSDSYFVLYVSEQPKYKAAPEDVDRSFMPGISWNSPDHLFDGRRMYRVGAT